MIKTTGGKMGKLTTHVLNTSTGTPASNMKIELFKILDNDKLLIGSWFTNKDGRVDNPILSRSDFKLGDYEILFHVGLYQDKHDESKIQNRFLKIVPIHFCINENRHYHIPLLYSQFGYSTYRGS